MDNQSKPDHPKNFASLFTALKSKCLLPSPLRINADGKPVSNTLPTILGAIGVILCTIPFYVSVVPPMTDVPQHALVARIIAEYENPIFKFSEYFDIEWKWAPTSFFYLLFVSLQKIVGPIWEARIYLTAWVALTWLSTRYLSNVRGQQDPWLPALAVLPITFCWYAYKGFLPFLMTIPIFNFAVAAWFKPWRALYKIPILWALLSLLYGFHIVGSSAAAAVIVVFACVQVLIYKDTPKHLVVAGIAVAPIPIFTGLFLFGGSGPSSHFVYTDLLNTFVDIIKFTCASLSHQATLTMLLWIGLIGCLCLIRWRHLVGDILFTGVLTLVLLAFIMPQSLGSLWPAGPRLFPYVILLVIACLPWSDFPRVPAVLTCMMLLVLLCSSTVYHALSINKGLRDFLGGISVIEPGKRILPLLIDANDGSRWVDPYWALISTYTLIKGGSHPYVFATPHIKTGASPLKYRSPNDRKYAFLYDADHIASDYIGVSDYYDYVLIWGRASELHATIGREMEILYVQGKATLFARPATRIGSNENGCNHFWL
jgi:hypothetical protein